MIRMLSATLVCLVLVSQANAQSYISEGGGWKDPSTGIVWGEGLKSQTGSWYYWSSAFDVIAALSLTDVNGQTYDDWRMASLSEMQNLIANNKPLVEEILMSNELPLDTAPTGEVQYWTGDIGVWTGTTKGDSAYIVIIQHVTIYDQNGRFVDFQVTGGGQSQLVKKNSWATDAFPVRSMAGSGGKGGRR